MSKPFETTKPISDYLKSLGAFVINLHGSAFAIGFPDLVACLDGRFVAVEVKRPGETPRKLQVKVLEKITRAGGIAISATTVNDVATVLERL